MIAILLSATVVATAPSENAYNLLIQGSEIGVGWITNVNGTLYMRISDSGNLMWYPVVDTKNKIIDFANCIRLKANSRELVVIGGLSPNGARLTNVGPPLKYPPTLDKFPLKEVSLLMGYAIKADLKKRTIDFTPISEGERLNSPSRDCHQIGSPIQN
jgi:hypothetical protein